MLDKNIWYEWVVDSAWSPWDQFCLQYGPLGIRNFLSCIMINNKTSIFSQIEEKRVRLPWRSVDYLQQEFHEIIESRNNKDVNSEKISPLVINAMIKILTETDEEKEIRLCDEIFYIMCRGIWLLSVEKKYGRIMKEWIDKERKFLHLRNMIIIINYPDIPVRRMMMKKLRILLPFKENVILRKRQERRRNKYESECGFRYNKNRGIN